MFANSKEENKILADYCKVDLYVTEQITGQKDNGNFNCNVCSIYSTVHNCNVSYNIGV